MEKHTKNTHRGRVLHQTAEAYPGSIKSMVARTGYKYGTFFKHILIPDLSYSILAVYGKAMNKDFSVEFPEMAELSFYEPPKNNSSDLSNEQLKTAIQDLQGKLTNLHEKYTQMMEELYRLRDENRLLRERNAK